MSLNYYREEIKAKYEGKLSKEMSGPMYEVISKLMKVMVNRKLTQPTSFVGYVKFKLCKKTSVHLVCGLNYCLDVQSFRHAGCKLFVQGCCRVHVSTGERIHLCPQASVAHSF